MQTRKPIVAGQFYPGQHYSCVDQINECLDARTLCDSLPETIVAGIVPHAGWIYSGSLAALVFSAIRQQHEKVHTFVLFGAAHRYYGSSPALYDKGAWETPLGDAAIDEEMADAVMSKGTAILDPDAHGAEHSIEVQVPFVQYLFAGAKILPILVPPTEKAIGLGESVGEIIAQDEQRRIICLGSTDLTHYGLYHDFTPKGIGEKALEWAKDVNDKKFIDSALRLDATALLAGAARNRNACGPGASAATVAAARVLGCRRGLLLAHATSHEIIRERMGTTSTDSVGYAAIVF
jgi:AmmeMemoRadiSam system protein B